MEIIAIFDISHVQNMTALTFGGLGRRREKNQNKTVIPGMQKSQNKRTKKKIGQLFLQGNSARS